MHFRTVYGHSKFQYLPEKQLTEGHKKNVNDLKMLRKMRMIKIILKNLDNKEFKN